MEQEQEDLFKLCEGCRNERIVLYRFWHVAIQDWSDGTDWKGPPLIQKRLRYSGIGLTGDIFNMTAGQGQFHPCFSFSFSFSFASLLAIASLSSLALKSLVREYSSLRLTTAFKFSSFASGNLSCEVISFCMAQRYSKMELILHKLLNFFEICCAVTIFHC